MHYQQTLDQSSIRIYYDRAHIQPRYESYLVEKMINDLLKDDCLIFMILWWWKESDEAISHDDITEILILYMIKINDQVPRK